MTKDEKDLLTTLRNPPKSIKGQRELVVTMLRMGLKRQAEGIEKLIPKIRSGKRDSVVRTYVGTFNTQLWHISRKMWRRGEKPKKIRLSDLWRTKI